MLNKTETRVKFKITYFNENKSLNSLTFISTIAFRLNNWMYLPVEPGWLIEDALYSIYT